MMMSTRILTPKTDGWVFIGMHDRGEAWQHILKGLRVISSIDSTVENGPMHHVSVSKERGGAFDDELAFVALSFGLPVEKEDNSGSDGSARHLWEKISEVARA